MLAQLLADPETGSESDDFFVVVLYQTSYSDEGAILDGNSEGSDCGEET